MFLFGVLGAHPIAHRDKKKSPPQNELGQGLMDYLLMTVFRVLQWG